MFTILIVREKRGLAAFEEKVERLTPVPFWRRLLSQISNREESMEIDPKKIVSSVANGVISAVGVLPCVAENVAKNAADYAAAVSKDLADLKANMPDHPEVVPRVALGIVGQTLGAGLGMLGGIVGGVDKAIKEIRAETEKVTK